jgi:DNA repair protein RecN (Recombination protein N)
LLKVNQHINLLDSFAGVGEQLKRYQSCYLRLVQVRRELAELRQAEKNAVRRSETLSFQISEIESAQIRPGEEETLKDERNRLANAEGLASLVQEALVALDEGSPESPAATDLIGQVVHAIAGLARVDGSQTSLSDQASLLAESLSDLARELRSYQESIEFNPRRLDQVEDRLGVLHNLKRKYGDSIEEVLAYAEKARFELDTITHAGERILELQEEESTLLEQVGREGELLSQQRHTQAAVLAGQVESELDELHMSSARFQVDFQMRPDANGAPLRDGRRVAFDSHGLERIEFLIAPNPGEGFKPLVKIASGGETSRLMLALKNVLASADQVPTLIFDEIDQGIGGRVGAVVGQKLASLARRHQVLCVTHLPQLAAYGFQHFHVTKAVQEGRTTTQVEALDGETRLVELAQMFGEVSQGTLQSAKELLSNVAQQAHREQPASRASGSA